MGFDDTTGLGGRTGFGDPDALFEDGDELMADVVPAPRYNVAPRNVETGVRGEPPRSTF